MVDESDVVGSSPELESQAPESEIQSSEAAQEPSLQEKIQSLKESPLPASSEKEAKVIPAEGQASEPEVPKYQPNFKYKAFGKERELDPFYQSLIKDAESEKRVKDVFTKVDAFDDLKSRNDAMSSEYQQVSSKYKALDSDVKRVTGFLNSGDYGNFFKAMGISSDKLIGYLQHEARVAELGPVERQQYQDAMNLRANEYNRSQELNEMREMMNQQAVQYRTMQLDQTLSSPDMASAAQAWDAKMGQGSFRQLVIEEGAKIHRDTNRDLSPAEVAQAVVQKFKGFLEQPQMAPQAPLAAPSSQAPVPQAPVAPQAKPVIPNVQGRGSSPIAQRAKSLDDLKALYKQKYAEEKSESYE